VPRPPSTLLPPHTSRTHPADLATLLILAVVTATLAAAVARGVPLGRDLALHVALLAAFGVVAFALRRHPDARWTPYARGVAVIGMMFTLYSTLGHVAFRAIPWLADPALERADRLLALGRSPSLLLQSVGTPGWTEFLSVFYAAFIPYLYLSILLGLVGRPAAQRDEFVTAFALLYAASFMGYLFLPARGPIVYMADAFNAPLAGGPVHATIVRTIDGLGGPHGAFPSLHVGASFLAAAFDLRRGDRLRGWIYAPLVILIAAATIVLRYHYVVDLVAAVLLASGALYAAPRLLARRAGASR
jgi:membrane-associated phospholipid phosphatase